MFELIESSHRRAVDHELVDIGGDLAARSLWVYRDAPFGLLAHDGRADPRFVYANLTAQRCFEHGWDEFVGTPSRLSARADGQQDRDQLLARVEATGVADGYRGLRVAGSGRRFWIEDVVMWNLVDGSGTRCGQAALFPHWSDAD